MTDSPAPWLATAGLCLALLLAPGCVNTGGGYFFGWGGHAAGYGSMAQQGPLEVSSGSWSLTGVVQDEYDDWGQATLRFLDAKGAVLAEQTEGPFDSGDLVWLPFQITLAVPPGATTWEVFLDGTLVTGSWVNVFYDDLVLACAP